LVKVVDGDTIDLLVDLGFRVQLNVRVRLEGINTPEIRGPERQEGLRFKQHVVDWFHRNHNQCYLRTTKTGKYGRWLGKIWAGGDRRGKKPDFLDVFLSNLLEQKEGH